VNVRGAGSAAVAAGDLLTLLPRGSDGVGSAGDGGAARGRRYGLGRRRGRRPARREAVGDVDWKASGTAARRSGRPRGRRCGLGGVGDGARRGRRRTSGTLPLKKSLKRDPDRVAGSRE
jgi:hypothetical protein